MSKNFELLQQVETGHGSAAGTAATKARSPLHFHVSNGREPVVPMDLNRVAQEETLRLVQAIFLAPGPNPPRVVMFAGVDPGNGCSHVCARAAAVLASNMPGSVCLVDANLRAPSLPEFFGVTNHHGLVDSLRQNGSVRGYAKSLQPENLWLLSCGSLAADSSLLLNSEPMKARIAELRKEFDYVLIDSPPLNTYSDGMVLGQLADGAVLVLEANATRREVTLKVAADLRAAHIKILGAVLNKRTFAIPEALYRRL